MPCSTLLDPSCLIRGAVSGITGLPAGGGVLSSVAGEVRSGLAWMFTNTATLWLKLPDLYPVSEAPALHQVQAWLLPATAAVAAGGAIAAGARMTLTRRHAPLLDLTGGLAVIGLAAALGIALPTALMHAADAWTQWVLQKSSGGDLAGRLRTLLGGGYGDGIPDVAVIVFGSVATVASGIQGLLLLFREAAILILAAVLPLAAAGAIAPATRGWIQKVASWMLALILYPAAAACVYATGFTMIGSGTGLRALLIGFAMIVLAVFALPVLMRFFTWTTGTVSSSGGGAGQFLGLAAAGALGLGALRGGGPSPGGTSAAQQAQYLHQNNPPSGGPSASPPGGPGPSSGQSGTPGPSGSPGSSGADGSAGAGGRDGGPSAPGGHAPGSAGDCGSRRPGGGPAAPGEAANDGASAGAGAAGNQTSRRAPGNGPDGASGPAQSGSPAPSSGAAAGGKAAAGKPGPAAAGLAALFAAQAMASGAKNAAATAMDPEEKS